MYSKYFVKNLKQRYLFVILRVVFLTTKNKILVGKCSRTIRLICSVITVLNKYHSFTLEKPIEILKRLSAVIVLYINMFDQDIRW